MTRLEPSPVEGRLVTYLGPQVAPAVVATRIPNPRPALLVRVGRVGGEQLNLIQERPVVLFECWAADDLASWQLAKKVWGLVQGRTILEIAGLELSGRSLSTPVNYPDPVSNLPRYQFTGTFTVDLQETAS